MRWQAPWRRPLASRRICWRGWPEIHSPVWKGCPGIKMFSTVGRHLKKYSIQASITTNSVQNCPCQIEPTFSYSGLHTLPCPPPTWATSRLGSLSTLHRTPTDITPLFTGYCWATGIYISNIWLQVKSLKQGLQASQADYRHRQPSVRPTSCTCGCYSRLLHVHAGIKTFEVFLALYLAVLRPREASCAVW